MLNRTIFLAVLLFGGCVGTQPLAPKSVESQPKSTANAKVFEEEDTLILFGLRAEQLKEYATAAEVFNTLYISSNKKEYLYRSLQNDLVATQSQNVIKRVDEVLKGSKDDVALVRVKILALMQMERLEEAKNLATNLLEQTNEIDDSLLLSDIYVKLQKFDMAVKYLESAYAKDYSEKVLDKMSIILYVNLQKRADAIAQLETHIRVHGASEIICSRLIAFYSYENNIDGVLATYLKLYVIKPEEDVAKKIVQIYSYQREYMKMMSFLEENGSDDATLLQLYANMKDYTKAFPLADKLYKESGEIEYLGQSAIYEYESAKNKSDKELLKRVSQKFEKVVQENKNPLYLNYYGFILIDHNMDAKEGIKLVNMALESEPTSIYYLDSLAWGYFKLGQCQEAHKVMQKVFMYEGANDSEVLLHRDEIEKCLKTNKEVKK